MKSFKLKKKDWIPSVGGIAIPCKMEMNQLVMTRASASINTFLASGTPIQHYAAPTKSNMSQKTLCQHTYPALFNFPLGQRHQHSLSKVQDKYMK